MPKPPRQDPLERLRSAFGERTEPLTPRETEAELSRLISAISTAALDLAEFRRERAKAYLAYRRAKTTAAHSTLCPKVERGGTTVAEREDWIDSRIVEEFELLTKWDTMVEIGVESLRATLAQAEVVRSLNTSVRAAYERAGYQRENQ
jgi:hypothetical protein